MQNSSLYTSIFSFKNYSPFGMVMPGRSFTSESYRFGFNGMEKDGEIQNTENFYVAEFGQMVGRIGRRWNPNPKPNSSISVYSLFADNPLYYTDVKLDTPSHTPQTGVCEDCPVAELKHGDFFSDVQNQKYTATFSDMSKDEFDKFKNQLSLDPGKIINNPIAKYDLIDRDGSYGVTVGDHLDIELGDNGSVVVGSVEVDDNYISVTVYTLKGHPDAGYNTFSASYNKENNTMTWTTENYSRTNMDVPVIGDFAGWSFGRPLQKLQWRVVIDMVQLYIDKPIIEATKTITEYDYNDFYDEVGVKEFSRTIDILDKVNNVKKP